MKELIEMVRDFVRNKEVSKAEKISLLNGLASMLMVLSSMWAVIISPAIFQFDTDVWYENVEPFIWCVYGSIFYMILSALAIGIVDDVISKKRTYPH